MIGKLFGKKNQNNVPDFSEIDSQEKAEAAAKTGTLVPVHLMPLRFGGVDGVENIVYAPPITVELKERNDDMVQDLLEQGKVASYSAIPQYKGNSFVPSSIVIKASGESVFEYTINIW